MSGRVVHFEIPFDDGDRARNFYKDVFGWNVQEMPGMAYTAVSTGPTSEEGMPNEPGFINGGMFQREAVPPRVPVITVEVDSIDATLAQIEALGGSTARPKEAIADMGFAAYLEDPEGNLIGLWESVSP